MTKLGFAILALAAVVGGAAIYSNFNGRVEIPTTSVVSDWPAYGKDPGGSRHSPLTQITKANVRGLKVAWTYRTGDTSDGTRWKQKSAFEATPILADGTLYLCTPFD